MSELSLAIGGLGLQLSGDAGVVGLAARAYERFEGKGESPALGVHIAVSEDAGDLGAGELSVKREGALLSCVRSDFDGTIDIDRRQCSLRVYPTDYMDVSIDAFLRLAMSVWAVGNDALMVHGAGIRIGGTGLGFIGKSGAGKTTISRLAVEKGYRVLCDEITMYRSRPEGWEICGTPFSGELAGSGSNETAPLSDVFLLRKSSEMRIGKARKGTELAQVAKCVLLFQLPERLSGSLLRLLVSLVTEVTPKTLHFRPEPEVWELLA